VTETSHLNGLISLFERGLPAFGTFAVPEIGAAIAASAAPWDGVLVETEHIPWDPYKVRDFLQYLLDRRQIVAMASAAPAVTPIVRVPPNGQEMNQFFAKQALDLGAYGIVWPHISTMEQAWNAVAACRYPRLPSAPIYEPQGLRGDGPAAAVRYWGVSQQEYYRRADIWPLAPEGDVLVVLMCEDTVGIQNLDDILANVPGVGAILIGEGDLSQELGHPREYQHPEVLRAVAEIVEICRRHGVVVGHPHVDTSNVQGLLDDGFRLLLSSPSTSYTAVDVGREHLKATTG
jgi:4-hydroxy-2-oxoheptanedioate aldolase